jgi:hypothetical protein
MDGYSVGYILGIIFAIGVAACVAALPFLAIGWGVKKIKAARSSRLDRAAVRDSVPD